VAEVFLCVRRTIDWRDETRIDPQFRPKVEAWNATFPMPYHVFRQRLKEIAAANLARVEGAAVADLAAVPEGAVVAPVDDDDWFAPDLATELRRAFDPLALGFLWPRYVLEARPWLARAPDHARYTCGTNNYAVVNAEGWGEAAEGHGRASRRFDAHGDRVRRLPRMLSIQNRNLSSQTVLAWGRPTISRLRLRRRWRRHRKLYDRVRLPAELAWAEPCVRAMAALMRELG
jgi:hypothetical protein